MALMEVIDDHVLARYRELADAECAAFDELEHAYEEGDRLHFELDLNEWLSAIREKSFFLRQLGIELVEEAVSS
jgi:hypothetical protein